MEVHFSPDVETRLQHVALASGKNAEQLVKETVDRMLDHQTRSIADVARGVSPRPREANLSNTPTCVSEPKDFLVCEANSADHRLDAIVNHIQRDHSAAARKLAQVVLGRVELLAGFPGLGRPGEVDGTRDPRRHAGVDVYRL
jgi:hypothetical protein